MTELDLSEIVQSCVRKERRAQHYLYEHFKGKMFAVCLRYANNRYDAEDLLQEGFVKVFRDIHQYRGEGSLEGWIRRVIVHVSLQYIQKQRRQILEEKQYALENYEEDSGESIFGSDEAPKAIIKMMQKLAPGFRAVLNLYVLENYSHQQIAETLGISIGTSKSQLNRAKAQLRALLEQNLTS